MRAPTTPEPTTTRSASTSPLLKRRGHRLDVRSGSGFRRRTELEKNLGGLMQVSSASFCPIESELLRNRIRAHTFKIRRIGDRDRTSDWTR